MKSSRSRVDDAVTLSGALRRRFCCCQPLQPGSRKACPENGGRFRSRSWSWSLALVLNTESSPLSGQAGEDDQRQHRCETRQSPTHRYLGDDRIVKSRYLFESRNFIPWLGRLPPFNICDLDGPT